MTDAQLSNAVESWIETELLYQEALKHNVDKDAHVKNQIEQKRKEIIASRYADISVAADTNISDQTIDSIYYTQKDKFTITEDLYDLSHIVLINKNAADAVYKRLLKGDKFAQLAKDYSEDQATRVNGGDIGLLAESAFEKDMIDEIKK